MRGALIAIVCIAVGLSAPWAQAGEVRLRTSAVAHGDGPVLLADVAELVGDDAKQLAATVVVEDLAALAAGRAWAEVPLESVRTALTRAGARLGGLAVSGGVCVVRAPAEAATRKAEPPRAEPAGPAVVDEASAPVTVRGEVARTLSEMFGVAPSALRVKFDVQDEGLLSQSVFGRRIVVQPASGAGSSRIVLGVRVFQAGPQDAGAALLESRSIKADVEIKRTVVILKEGVRRKDGLARDNLTESEMWITPDGGTPFASIDEAAGSLARSRIAPGTVLRRDHVESAVVVKRNDLVTVHCLSQGFEVKTRARAAADGSVGDTIPFRIEGSKRTFSARIESEGVAVVDLSAMGRRAEMSGGER